MGEMSASDTPIKQKAGKGRAVAMLLVLCVAGGLLWGWWYLVMRDRVSTDNAYVAADTAMVSSRVPGSVLDVRVGNDDHVSEGDLLLVLDPRDFEAERDRHRAALKRIDAEIARGELALRLAEGKTSAQLEAADASVQGAYQKERELRHVLAGLEQTTSAARADLADAERDSRRYANLLSEGAGTEQQRDRTSTAYKKARAQVEASEARIRAAHASIGAAQEEIARLKGHRGAARADLLNVDLEKATLAALRALRGEAEAVLHIAELNLSYTKIRAPIPGYVAQKRIQVGERIQPGQALLALVPLREAYVEANFKENQLKDMRIGQPVEVKADVYPGVLYRGKVVGIRAGTGAAFSLLPPENATGNWIKVVQRVPVKIALETIPPEYPLRLGTSLEVVVHTQDRSGPLLRKEGARRSGPGTGS